MQVTSNSFEVGVVSFEAAGDRVLVHEDPFVSGYECKQCAGHGWLICADCEDGTSRLNSKIQCKTCNGTRKAPCRTCEGKGGLLIVPEKSQRRPTTGEIVSIGEKVVSFHCGDKVMYGSFAGHVVDIDSTVLRILHESEILCRVSGHLAYRMGDAE
jgi:co-chaperonin GroES (HSP10)